MLVKQNSIFCAIYVMLVPLRIGQIGWFNCHVSKCLSMDDCTTEAYSTPTWPGTQKLGIGPTLLLSWRNKLTRKNIFFLNYIFIFLLFLTLDVITLSYEIWCLGKCYKAIYSCNSRSKLDNLQWTVHSYLSDQNCENSGSSMFGHIFIFTECVWSKVVECVFPLKHIHRTHILTKFSRVTQ
jgi:hypothetical protein